MLMAGTRALSRALVQALLIMVLVGVSQGSALAQLGASSTPPPQLAPAQVIAAQRLLGTWQAFGAEPPAAETDRPVARLGLVEFDVDTRRLLAELYSRAADRSPTFSERCTRLWESEPPALRRLAQLVCTFEEDAVDRARQLGLVRDGEGEALHVEAAKLWRMLRIAGPEIALRIERLNEAARSDLGHVHEAIEEALRHLNNARLLLGRLRTLASDEYSRICSALADLSALCARARDVIARHTRIFEPRPTTAPERMLALASDLVAEANEIVASIEHLIPQLQALVRCLVPSLQPILLISRNPSLGLELAVVSVLSDFEESADGVRSRRVNVEPVLLHLLPPTGASLDRSATIVAADAQPPCPEPATRPGAEASTYRAVVIHRFPLGYTLRNVQQLQDGSIRFDQAAFRIDSLDRDRLRDSLVALRLPALLADLGHAELIVRGSVSDNTLTVVAPIQVPLPSGAHVEAEILLFASAGTTQAQLGQAADLNVVANRLTEALARDTEAFIRDRLALPNVTIERCFPTDTTTGQSEQSGSCVHLFGTSTRGPFGPNGQRATRRDAPSLRFVARLELPTGLDESPTLPVALALDLRWENRSFAVHLAQGQQLADIAPRISDAVAQRIGRLIPRDAALGREPGSLLGEWLRVVRVEPVAGAETRLRRDMVLATVVLAVAPPGLALSEEVRVRVTVAGLSGLADLQSIAGRVVDAYQRALTERLRLAASDELQRLQQWFARRQGQTIEAFGLSATMERVTASPEGLDICLGVRAGSSQIAISRLRLRNAQIVNDQLQAPQFDTRETSFRESCRPGARALNTARLVDLAASWLGVDRRLIEQNASITWSDGEVVVTAAVKAGEFGTIPLARVFIGWGGIRGGLVDQRDHIAAAVREQILRRGVLGNLGPVEGIAIVPDPDAPNAPLRFLVMGQIPLWAGLRAEVRVPLDLAEGRLGSAQVTAPDGGAFLAAVFGEAARAAGVNVAVTPVPNVSPITLSASGSFPLPLLDNCSLDIRDVRISVGGLVGGGVVEGRCGPAGLDYVPVPGTGLALVNPRVRLDLERPSRFGVGADVTADGGPQGSQALARLLRFDAMLIFDVETASAQLQGRAVLADTLPIFDADGALRLNEGLLRFRARTADGVRQIMNFDVDGRVHGRERRAEARASLQVLGLNLGGETRWEFLFDDRRVTWAGVMSFLGSNLGWTVTASPNLGDIRATGEGSLRIGGWEAAGARLGVDANWASIEFSVLNALRISGGMPSLQQITPAYLEELIRSFLRPDIDLESIRQWLSNPRFSLQPISRGSPSAEVRRVSGTVRLNQGGQPPLPPGQAQAQAREQALPRQQSGGTPPTEGRPPTGGQTGPAPAPVPPPRETPTDMVDIGDDRTGQRFSIRPTAVARQLLTGGAHAAGIRVLQWQFHIPAAAMPEWWRQNCSMANGQPRSGEDYVLAYPVADIPSLRIAAHNLLLIRHSNCGERDGRRGFVQVPLSIDLFLAPAAGTPTRERFDALPRAQERWNSLPESYRRLVTRLVTAAPGADASGEREAIAADQWPHRVVRVASDAAHAALLYFERTPGQETEQAELISARGRALNVSRNSVLGRILLLSATANAQGSTRTERRVPFWEAFIERVVEANGSNSAFFRGVNLHSYRAEPLQETDNIRDVLRRALSQESSYREIDILTRNVDSARRFYRVFRDDIDNSGVQSGNFERFLAAPERKIIVPVSRAAENVNICLYIFYDSMHWHRPQIPQTQYGLISAELYSSSNECIYSHKVPHQQFSLGAVGARLPQVNLTAVTGQQAPAPPSSWPNEESPLLPLFARILQANASPLVIGSGDAPQRWLLFQQSQHPHIISPSAIPTPLRQTISAFVVGDRGVPDPSHDMQRLMEAIGQHYPAAAASIITDLEGDASLQSLWLPPDRPARRSPHDIRAALAGGHGEAWRLRLYAAPNATGSRTWTLNVARLAQAWRDERRTCPPLRDHPSLAALQRAADGSVHALPVPERERVEREVENALLQWILNGRPAQHPACADPWGYVLQHAEAESPR